MTFVLPPTSPHCTGISVPLGQKPSAAVYSSLLITPHLSKVGGCLFGKVLLEKNTGGKKKDVLTEDREKRDYGGRDLRCLDEEDAFCQGAVEFS